MKTTNLTDVKLHELLQQVIEEIKARGLLTAGYVPVVTSFCRHVERFVDGTASARHEKEKHTAISAALKGKPLSKAHRDALAAANHRLARASQLNRGSE